MNYKEVQEELNQVKQFYALIKAGGTTSHYFERKIDNLTRRLNTLTPPHRSLPLAEVTVNGQRVAARILKEPINGKGMLTTVVLEETGQRISNTARRLQLAHIRG